MKRKSNFYTDKQGRVRYIGSVSKKKTTTIRLSAPRRKKEGGFITTEEGRVVFIGGPSSGGGGTTSNAANEELIDALGYYFGDQSDLINGYLRSEMRDVSDYDLAYFSVDSERELKDKLDGIISEIDYAIDGGTVKEPLTVYRGFDADAAGLNYINPGDAFSDPGFLSTSSNPAVGNANAIGRVPIFMVLTLQPGDHALESHGPMPEREWLLPRGLTLRLIEETDNPKAFGGGFRWNVEIVKD